MSITSIYVETGVLYWVTTTAPPYGARSSELVPGVKVDRSPYNWLLLYPDNGVIAGPDLSALAEEHPVLAKFVSNHRGWWASPDTVTVQKSYVDLDADRDQLVRQLEQQVEKTRLADERADANMRALEDFKLLVQQVGGAAAERHEWCAVYDEILVDLGLPRRQREIEVRVRVHFTTSVMVTATDDEEAAEKVDRFTTRRRWSPPSMFDEVEMTTPYDISWSSDENDE